MAILLVKHQGGDKRYARGKQTPAASLPGIKIHKTGKRVNSFVWDGFVKKGTDPDLSPFCGVGFYPAARTPPGSVNFC